MIDLHTHTLLSDGALLPSELVRRALVNGYTAIALTDHADHSNVDHLIKSLVKVSGELNKYWDIKVIPGVELTHIPLEAFAELTKKARGEGAGIVVAHGESPVEPVIPGTNKAAIEAGIDILAHPGYIKDDDVNRAKEAGVFLEITTRPGHSVGNPHVFKRATAIGAGLVLNTDSHAPGDLLTPEKRDIFLKTLTSDRKTIDELLRNSRSIVDRAGR